jgi:phosphate/sulfate permease
MENFYLVVIIVLFTLAVSSLIVGVSNDAVNFLNSAIGSRAAPKWIILLLASIGVLVGAAFSTGMMEVARKGIFHPDMFNFSEIMIIFLAVMITNVILLDAFNTFGLPTSTTVSLVFGLLGSAVAVSLVKIKNQGGLVTDLVDYVNTGKSLAIISGILISVLIAFTIGTIVQYCVRMVFSFHYEKKLRYLGSAFGGFALTVISYFILIKGIEGSTFAALPVGEGQIPLSIWVGSHTKILLLISFLGWMFLFQFLWWIFKADILSIVVLAGTFALAMAFAGNDLVNFIGVPVTGFKSFQAWLSSGGISPNEFNMGFLTGDVETPFILLVISGIIMIITLIISKKAKRVTETEVNLGRQMEGAERFGSSAISRALVRGAIRINKKITGGLPEPVNKFIHKRFSPVPIPDELNAPAFDKLRASVNLIVSSILIAFGTSLKLPLSTTYVTFMVAMGSSLADRAWGRDSAVYRVSGVFAVIGGWFLTAIIAFTLTAFIAWIISAGGMPVIIGLILISVGLAIRMQIIFRRRSQKAVEDDELIEEIDETGKRIEKSKNQVVKTIISTNKIYSFALDSFLNEDITRMRETMEMTNQFNAKTRKQKNKIIQTISKMKREDVDAGYFYIQVIDYQREISHSLNDLLFPLHEHLENQHKPFTKSQSEEIRYLVTEMDAFFNLSLHVVKEEKYDAIEDLVLMKSRMAESLNEIEKDQIKRIKNNEVNTRNSILFFKSLAETKNLLLHSVNLIKSHRDFILVNRKTV